MKLRASKNSLIAVLGFSCIFAYTFVFLLEPSIVLNLVPDNPMPLWSYFVFIIPAHALGLLLCGIFFRSVKDSLMVVNTGSIIILLLFSSLLTTNIHLQQLALIVSGFVSGLMIASAGNYLKYSLVKDNYMVLSAIALIATNGIFGVIRLLAVYFNSATALTFMIVLFTVGARMVTNLGVFEIKETVHHGSPIKPLVTLFLFILIVSINTTLFQEYIYSTEYIDPQLSLISYMLIYIGVIILMLFVTKRNFFRGYLLLAIALITLSTVLIGLIEYSFPLIYIVYILVIVATGLFDLFWFSILAQVIEYSRNPPATFGFGILARVIGKIAGLLLATSMANLKLIETQVEIFLLMMVILNLFLLPTLHVQLSQIIENNSFLIHFGKEKSQAVPEKTHIESNLLTIRESEILNLILEGKSNKQIASELFISESTVKSHLSSIYSKYNVNSRAEIISSFIKQDDNKS